MSEVKMITQAERILKKFGGHMKLAKALKDIGCPKSITQIYKWTYDRSKGGTNGVIPNVALFDIVQAAKAKGIVLTSEDLDFRPKSIEVNSVNPIN